MEKTVVELFAGVGGFRVGLNEVSLSKTGETIEKDNFRFVWANQWEPSTKNVQHAFDCYSIRFGNSEFHSNEDITRVDKKLIPNHTLLVGGFPCQDYSVARTISNEKGIQGKKGVLWWEIQKILDVKRPPFVLLENVDRLLKSPALQRGRDFGVILRSLNDLDYGVQWRVINAAEYGHPQRRRRVFIFAFHKSSNYYKDIIKESSEDILLYDGIFAKAFPVKNEVKTKTTDISIELYDSLAALSENFKFPFENAGLMIKNQIITGKVSPIEIEKVKLSNFLESEQVDSKYFLNQKQIEKFKYLRDSKSIERTNKETGIKYFYAEGTMSFPDRLDLPARTMLTSEASLNRSTHVISDLKTSKLRLLTPLEAERLNEFPEGWTDTGMPYKRRYFMMGNALVTGIIMKLGKQLSNIIDQE